LTDIKKIAEGYRLGASTFLIKPLIAAELMQMLKAVNGLAINKVAGGLILSIVGSYSGVVSRSAEISQSSKFA
jgi:hypothetical protein